MKIRFFLFHPISVFVLSLIALLVSLILYIHWHLKLSTSFENFVQTFKINPHVISRPETFTMIFVISVLVALILGGMVLIFVYYQKTILLFSRQEGFINNFTHELKTPLASIRLYLETFIRHDLSKEEQRVFIDYMLRDTQRLSGHVEQILLLGQLEHGETNYRFAPLSLTGCIKDFLKESSYLFQNGEIHFHDPKEEMNISGVKEFIDILLVNILSNAFKYNLTRPRVDISILRTGKWIDLDIKDNGIGLLKRDMKRIFRKFYRSDNSLKEKRQGSGLGLYLSSQILKLHKGKLEALSRGAGQGTTFRLRFKSLDPELTHG